jgi:cation diffusion facilitator family transporter
MAPVYREASRAAMLGLGVNLALGLAKLVGGVAGDSFALLADAVNSLGDVFTSRVVLFALWLAQRPPDRDHPYGHTRAEAIAASNVALLILMSALMVAWEAVQRLGVQHDLPPAWTLWIAGTNVAIKEGLYQYKVRVARRIGSAVILANAWDHRSDALAALAVLVGLGVVRWGGPAFIWADEAAALVVMSAILWSSASLFRRSAYELMDMQAEEGLVKALRQVAAEVSGVRGIDKLWVRKTGLEYLVDIHVEVDRLATVEEGHRIGHQVKDRLLELFPNVHDVLVHLEPHPGAPTDLRSSF